MSGWRNNNLGAGEGGLGLGTPRTDVTSVGLLVTQLETGVSSRFVSGTVCSLPPTLCRAVSWYSRWTGGRTDRQGRAGLWRKGLCALWFEVPWEQP